MNWGYVGQSSTEADGTRITAYRLFLEEATVQSQLLMGSIKIYSPICYGGFDREIGRARLKTECRIGNGVTRLCCSRADSGETFPDKNGRDPKVNAPNWSEGSETSINAIGSLAGRDGKLSETDKNLSAFTIVDTTTSRENWRSKDDTKSKSQEKRKVKLPDSNMEGITELNLTTEIVQEIENSWDKKSRRYKNLHRIIFDERVLAIAYRNTYRTFFALTPGGDSMSLERTSKGKIRNLSKSLKENLYQTRISRRVMIPKKDPKEKRPLTVLSAQDKIVSNAIYLVLQYVYEGYKCPKGDNQVGMSSREPYFMNSSHGFRPGRSCHSALNTTLTWGLVSWYIDVDIRKYYDSIDHKRLINILNERIDDARLFDLLNSLFKAKVLFKERGGPYTSTGLGVPQGNPLSPLLANIYLHKLDEKMAELKKEIDKGQPSSRTTLEWRKATYVKVSELSAAKTPAAKRRLKRELYRKKVKEATRMGIPRTPVTDEKQGEAVYHRLFYVRYADDFLVGIRGPKHIAEYIRSAVVQFLKENLSLEVKKADLAHSRSTAVRLLGFDIKTPSRNERAIVSTKEVIAFKKLRGRVLARKKRLENSLTEMSKKILIASQMQQLKKLMGGVMKKADVRKYANLINRKEILSKMSSAIAKIQDEPTPHSKMTSMDQRSIEEIIQQWKDQTYTSLRDSWMESDLVKGLLGDKVLNLHQELLEALKSGSSMGYVAELKEKKMLELKNRGAEQIDRVLYGQPQGLNPKIYIPIKEIKERFNAWGMVKMNKFEPKANGIVFKYHDVAIIDYYKEKAYGLLHYYQPANNFYELKRMVDYHMRWSLLHTLAGKHKKKVWEIVKLFGKTPALYVRTKTGHRCIACFLTPNEINHMPRKFSTKIDPITSRLALDRPIMKLSLPKVLYSVCGVKGCTSNEIEVHHVRALERQTMGYTVVSVKSKKGKRVKGLSKVESSLKRKQIPLCRRHHQDWHKGAISSSDLDIEYINSNVKILGRNELK